MARLGELHRPRLTGEVFRGTAFLDKMELSKPLTPDYSADFDQKCLGTIFLNRLPESLSTALWVDVSSGYLVRTMGISQSEWSRATHEGEIFA
jgi:hypothetical protein